MPEVRDLKADGGDVGRLEFDARGDFVLTAGTAGATAGA